MEGEVRNAVTDGTDDLVLAKLVEITARSINTKKDLFPNLLSAPAFYERYFRTWVQEALDEHEIFQKFHASALEPLVKRLK